VQPTTRGASAVDGAISGRTGGETQAGSARRTRTIRILLESHDLKPWREKMWCVAELGDAYIAQMEDVLALYEKPTMRRNLLYVWTRNLSRYTPISAHPSG